jgi:hypothetical protein
MQTLSTQSIPDDHNVEKVGLRRLAEIIRNNLAYWVKPDGRPAIARACTELENADGSAPVPTSTAPTIASSKVALLFDGPPGPESGRFIEAENAAGEGVKVGAWVQRGDGIWALELDVILPTAPVPQTDTSTGAEA